MDYQWIEDENRSPIPCRRCHNPMVPLKVQPERGHYLNEIWFCENCKRVTENAEPERSYSIEVDPVTRQVKYIERGTL